MGKKGPDANRLHELLSGQEAQVLTMTQGATVEADAELGTKGVDAILLERSILAMLAMHGKPADPDAAN